MSETNQKKSMTRDQIISLRLKNMTGMAVEINKYPNLVRDLADKNQYLRIRGESYMPVSLAEKSPLCGYGNNGYKNLINALSRFNLNPHEICEDTLREKEERRFQCWIVKSALNNGRSVKNLFPDTYDEFDDILFAFDEVSLGDVNHPPISRCDLLCIAKKNDRWYPLIVELKSQRIGKSLVDQVVRYASDFSSFGKELSTALEAVTGVKINHEKLFMMVIMPKLNSLISEKTNKFYRDNNVRLFEYSVEENRFALTSWY